MGTISQSQTSTINDNRLKMLGNIPSSYINGSVAKLGIGLVMGRRLVRRVLEQDEMKCEVEQGAFSSLQLAGSRKPFFNNISHFIPIARTGVGIFSPLTFTGLDTRWLRRSLLLFLLFHNVKSSTSNVVVFISALPASA